MTTMILHMITPTKKIIKAQVEPHQTVLDAEYTLNKIIKYQQDISTDYRYTFAKNNILCNKHFPLLAYNHYGRTISLEIKIDYNYERIKKAMLNDTKNTVNGVKKSMMEFEYMDDDKEDTIRAWAGKNKHLKIDSDSPLNAIMFTYYHKTCIPRMIFVKTLTGRTLNLQVPQNANGYYVKAMIKASENIPIDQQRLVCQSKQIGDDDKLYRVSDHKEGRYIEIVRPNGKTKKVYIPLHKDGEMMNEIDGKCHNEFSKLLDDDIIEFTHRKKTHKVPKKDFNKYIDSLKTKGINDLVVHLILRLRGGMYNEVSGRNGKYEPLKKIEGVVFEIKDAPKNYEFDIDI